MTDKVSRTLRLDRKIDAELVALCEARGVTVNSWLVNVVGDAIYKANSQKRMEQATLEASSKSLEQMIQLMGGLSE